MDPISVVIASRIDLSSSTIEILALSVIVLLFRILFLNNPELIDASEGLPHSKRLSTPQHRTLVPTGS
jgi:hypothetical protein